MATAIISRSRRKDSYLAPTPWKGERQFAYAGEPVHRSGSPTYIYFYISRVTKKGYSK